MDAGRSMTPVVDIVLRPDPGAGKRARDAVSQSDAAPAAVRDDVRLLVSELVTNSVRHASLGALGWIRVRAYADSGRIRVEVEDSGPGFAPRARPLSAHQTSGWGLFLVEQLASRWGATRTRPACAWFEIDLPEEDAGADAA